MDAADRRRAIQQAQAWMTMQRQRCEQLASNRVAEYHARVRALTETSAMTLQVRGSYGGPGSNYGRAVSENGWSETVRALVERR
jgi:hypothetical protein